MPPHRFDEAIALITEYAYDENSPASELLPRVAWKAFTFGLDAYFSDAANSLEVPGGSQMAELEARIALFHDTFLGTECQDVLAETACRGNVTKVAAAVQLHVSRYLFDTDTRLEQVDESRMTHSIALATFCLCSSIRLSYQDDDLAGIYWKEVAATRGHSTQLG